MARVRHLRRSSKECSHRDPTRTRTANVRNGLTDRHSLFDLPCDSAVFRKTRDPLYEEYYRIRCLNCCQEAFIVLKSSAHNATTGTSHHPASWNLQTDQMTPGARSEASAVFEKEPRTSHVVRRRCGLAPCSCADFTIT